jgi:serine/threonine protein kinase
VKIADLGLSKRVQENIDASSAAIGTERYCAPEVLRITAGSSPNEEPLEQSHKAARDLWALGEVVFQILAKRPAFSSNYEVYRFAEGHETLGRQLDSLRDRDLSVECLAFVAKLLIPDPKSRISAAEAVLDPWLLSVELSSPSTSRSSTP